MPGQLENADVLVGLETGDDAAVYRVRSDLALVVTTDFFTPIVDDAYTFGAIAAANALSDIYAMGGNPLMAVNLVAFPAKELPLALLSEILRGGLDKAHEAGIDILGGHSIDDHEPKYGLAAIGTVHPDRVVRNRGGRVGDRLVLTKPIGTGIISTAIKHGVAPAPAEEAAVQSMLQLNRAAAAAMAQVAVHAATDITGFGLLGHLHSLAKASAIGARVEAKSVPLLPGVLDLAEAGEVPSGTRSNERFLQDLVTWPKTLPAPWRTALSDAQTSGGLLLAVAAVDLERLQAELGQRGLTGHAIGELVAGPPGRIQVA